MARWISTLTQLLGHAITQNLLSFLQDGVHKIDLANILESHETGITSGTLAPPHTKTSFQKMHDFFF